MISEYTHFTETSSSVIDLVLTSNKNNIFLSRIGDPFFATKYKISLSGLLHI